MKVTCPNCGLTVGEQIGGKLGLGLAGFYFGSRVNPLLAFAFGLAGAFLGHELIDTAIRRCPQCGAVFRIAGGLL